MRLRERRARHVVLGLAALTLVGAAAGCGSTTESDDSAATGATATATATVEATADTTAADTWAQVVAFNDALAAQQWDTAASLATDASPAAAYVAYRSQVEAAQQAAGMDPAPAGEVAADEAAGTVTVTIDADGSPVTYVWSDFETDGGLVSTWTTEQGPLGQQISSPASSAEAAGAILTLPSAYITTAGEFYVIVGISAVDDTISVDSSATLRLPDGSTSDSATTVGADEVAPGDTAYVLYTFPAGGLDGVLVYEVQNSSDAPAAVELALS